MAERSKSSDKARDDSMTTSQAGKMGGERVRELVEEGKETEHRSGKSDDFGERRSSGDSRKDTSR
jgi:hypothetical protein